MSKFEPIKEFAAGMDSNFNDARGILREFVKNGPRVADYKSRVSEVIGNLEKDVQEIQEEVDLMLVKSAEISEVVEEKRRNMDRLHYHLSKLEKEAEEGGNYTVFSQEIQDQYLNGSVSPQMPNKNALNKPSKPQILMTVESPTPPKVFSTIQATSSSKSAMKTRSAKKSHFSQDEIPDWAMQASEVAFTPGLFPKGASVKSLSKSDPRGNKKHTTKAKHLNF